MEQNTSIEKPLPAIMSLINEAWVLYKSRFQSFLAISVLLVVFELIFNQATGVWLVALIVLLYVGVSVFAQAAILGNLIKSKDIGLSASLAYAAKHFNKYLWVTILVALVSMAGIVLVVPTIIWSISLNLAIVVLAVEGSTGMKALLESREYVRGRWWAVFLALFVFQIFVFLIPTIFIGMFNVKVLESIYSGLVTPLSIVYIYVLYKHLKSSRHTVEIRDEKRFKILAVFGLVVIVSAIVFGTIYKDFLQEKGFLPSSQLQTEVK